MFNDVHANEGKKNLIYLKIFNLKNELFLFFMKRIIFIYKSPFAEQILFARALLNSCSLPNERICY